MIKMITKEDYVCGLYEFNEKQLKIVRKIMTEKEVMRRAKMYIEKLANGINPLDDTDIPEDEAVNNVKISRCLFYVSDILRQLIEKDDSSSKKSSDKENFNISFDEIQKFRFSDTPIPISEIAKRINELTENENMKKISYKHLNDWLVNIGMLCQQTESDGKLKKLPTATGIEIGITVEVRRSMRGEYTVVVYNRDAQKFIIDNIDSVIGLMYS